ASDLATRQRRPCVPTVGSSAGPSGGGLCEAIVRVPEFVVVSTVDQLAHRVGCEWCRGVRGKMEVQQNGPEREQLGEDEQLGPLSVRLVEQGRSHPFTH